MFVANYLETSLLDWQGKISCVLFLSGCNFRCPWCQNRDLALGKIENSISVESILLGTSDKKNWIDGFVITGGEPTINADLKKIASLIKSRGFLVKIDTNGSNPGLIEEMISEGLADSVAMDIKTSLQKEKYNKAAGVEVNLSNINRTIDILLKSKVEVLFRTTAVSGIVDIEDIKKIAERTKGARYIIQKFKPHDTLDERYAKVSPFSEEDIKKMEELSYAKLF